MLSDNHSLIMKRGCSINLKGEYIYPDGTVLEGDGYLKEGDICTFIIRPSPYTRMAKPYCISRKMHDFIFLFRVNEEDFKDLFEIYVYKYNKIWNLINEIY